MYFIPGCPAPVEDGPRCTRPCPTNCEQCYPGTGVCQKCKHGYQGTECEPGKSRLQFPDNYILILARQFMFQNHNYDCSITQGP